MRRKRCMMLDFYPRPPRGGRRWPPLKSTLLHGDFYPRPPRGGRQEIPYSQYTVKEFLSTPSARRATRKIKMLLNGIIFLSTPSARRATFLAIERHDQTIISIHALREEGDEPKSCTDYTAWDFYPRPPRGGRPISSIAFCAAVNFYPRPPRGGRLHCTSCTRWKRAFLSTPSARRATIPSPPVCRRCSNFYPRPPRGGRLSVPDTIDVIVEISIHALREEGDGVLADLPAVGLVISIHALREEGDSYNPPAAARNWIFLSTPSARRATAKTEKNISAFVSL